MTIRCCISKTSFLQIVSYTYKVHETTKEHKFLVNIYIYLNKGEKPKGLAGPKFYPK